MIFEALIVLSTAAIFIILARRLPETNLDGLNADFPVERDLAQNHKFNLIPLKNVWNKIKSISWIRLIKIKKTPVLPPAAQTVQDLIEEADLFIKDGDLKSAEDLCLKAVTKSPENPKIYNRLGIIYLQQESFADARDAFLALLKLDDRVAGRHYNLALAYLGLKMTQKAKVSIKKALELNPDNEKYQSALKKLEI